ncbi:nucleotide exchange factor GrpE [Alterileibacterium massiliense]|uniref:nucleotide exchange factor GrpE n=1 Tax=Alterileibacterium massiliense TaxID=1870997 RepID=UPI0009F4981D|nr:nucleotide exchange factor GrpE [Alterileibacterium massiliense]
MADEKKYDKGLGEKKEAMKENSELSGNEEKVESKEAVDAKEAKKDKELKEDMKAEESISKEAKSNENKEVADEDISEEISVEDFKKQADDRYARLMAEFQNFKKRSAKEKQDIHSYANEKIIKDLLDVLDNFERAISLMENGNPDVKSDENNAMQEGISLILSQLLEVLTKAGLEEIEALGQEFDPKFHHAVLNEPSDEFKSGEVSKVLQKGYKLNDRVIRPAMVVVSE